MSEGFMFPVVDEGQHRWIEAELPGTALLTTDIDEATGKLMVWADAPEEPPPPPLPEGGGVIELSKGVIQFEVHWHYWADGTMTIERLKMWVEAP